MSGTNPIIIINNNYEWYNFHMKPKDMRKWRKKHPRVHKSYAEKRNRAWRNLEKE